MANSPPDTHVLRYSGAGNIQVFQLQANQTLSSQDGSDVGGGISVGATAAGTYAHCRVIEFLDDRYALVMVAGDQGVYKKGGSGLWDLVDLAPTPAATGACSGLHILHIKGRPALCYMMQDTLNDMYGIFSYDGVTWTQTIVANDAFVPATYGHSIVISESIFWIHRRYTSGAGDTMMIEYDFELDAVVRHDPDFDITGDGSTMTLCSHRRGGTVPRLMLWGKSRLAGNPVQLIRLDDAHVLTALYSEAGVAGDMVGSNTEHSAMFTDPTTGELIVFAVGTIDGDVATRVYSFPTPETGPTSTPTIVTSSMLGAVEGADKYIALGAAADLNRRWAVTIDISPSPTSPRIFLWTWVNGSDDTECWEYIDSSSEIRAVASLIGINSEYAIIDNYIGGDMYSPITRRVEIGDISRQRDLNADDTKIFFRVYGSGAVGVLDFYGDNNENAPNTQVDIVAGSLAIESGTPATTPSISGNTIINLTPDAGVVLYSIELVATSVLIALGDRGTFFPRFI